MLLFRLKHEFRELRFVLSVWFLSLLVLGYVVNLSTQAPELLGRQHNSNFHTALQVITPFVVIGSALAIIFFLFRPDHFKSPSAFWNTRPIRGKTIFFAKWLILQITITLPFAIFGVVYCFLLGQPSEAWFIGLEYGIEAMLVTTAISYSTIATPVRQLTAWLFIGGLAITAIALSLLVPHNSFEGSLISPEQKSLNLIVITIVLLITFAILFFRQIKGRHRATPLLVFPLLGCGTILAVFISPIPLAKTPAATETITATLNGKARWGGGYEGDQDYLMFHQAINAEVLTPYLQDGGYIANNELKIDGLPSNFEGHVEASIRSNQIRLKFFKKEATPNGSSGSGSLEDESNLAALQMVTPITITGRVLIKTPKFDPVVNLSPVSLGTWTDAPPLKYAVMRERNEIKVATRRHHPFSLWQENKTQRLAVALLKEGEGSWNEGGSSSNGGAFQSSEQDFRLMDSEETSIKEALKSSTLTISQRTGTDHQILNVTIHTTIPEPNKVLELIEPR